MNREFKVLSENVIKRDRNLGEEVYFTRVDSAESLQRYFYNEEDIFNVSFKNIEIDTEEKGTFAKGVLGLFSDISNDDDTVERYIEIIYCSALGLFVSNER